MMDGEKFVSDNGNYIADCRFVSIEDPKKLDMDLNMIPGVVDNGLFIGLADKVIVASKNGTKILERQGIMKPRIT